MINKKRIFQILAISAILIASYLAYSTYQDYKSEKEWKAYVATLVHTASPNVKILKDTVTIDYLGTKRTLSIYLPANYEQDTIAYPVLYFLDGQSLFDEKILEGAEWQIDEVLDSLGTIGGPQAIVVGVYNADDRLTEYKPFLSPYLPKEKVVTGVEHGEWIATDLKKWVDARYRTKKDAASTTIGGASLGGLMSYYMLTTYPEVYGGAIVFSPSFWVNEKVYELDKQISDLSTKRIYMNAGALEKQTVESIEKMADLLRKRGMNDTNLQVDVEAAEGHWHMTWRKGFKKAYPWILGE